MFFWPQGIWDLSSSTRDQTHILPALESKVSTTEPPGKFQVLILELNFSSTYSELHGICLMDIWRYTQWSEKLLEFQNSQSGDGKSQSHTPTLLSSVFLCVLTKLQYFGHLMQGVDSLEKTDAGRDLGQEEKGTTEDEMAGWCH